MYQYDVIVIGGGLGGLSAGAALSKLGKKVLLLEQHYIPGGCATTFKRKEFIAEVGLHEMDGFFDPELKQSFFDYLEITENVQLEAIPELFHLKAGEYHFTLPHGWESTKQTLLQSFPHEATGIEAFFQLLTGLSAEMPKLPKEKWKTLLLYPLYPILFPHVVKAARQSIGDWLDTQIQDDQLKLILLTNLLYYSDDPYRLSLLYFCLGQAGYIRGGGFFIQGGSQRLSDHLANLIEKNGGQVLLGKKVQDIILHKGRVSGVRFKDAFNETLVPTEVYAQAVVGNAALPLLAEMLPEEARPKLRNKIKDWEPSISLLTLYLGFNKPLNTLGVKHYSTFINGEGVRSPKDLKANYQGDWSKKGFAFVDYSQVDSRLAPDGKSFAVICAADDISEWENLDTEAYQAKKEAVAQTLLQRLEAHYPGLLPHLCYYEVATAKTIQRYTANPAGAPYGYAQTLAQTGMKRIRHKTPIPGLYVASAWAFPGGGYTATLLSGFLTAMEMKDKIKWSAAKAAVTLPDSRNVKLLQKSFIADNTLELTFEKPKGFVFEAGQYAVLRLYPPQAMALDMPLRSLSIVSHPEEENLRFAMRISSSPFKQLCASMAPGDTATIFGPMGSFTLQNNKNNLAFIIAGIGITPVLPMMEALRKQNFPGKVFLFYTNKTEAATAYHAFLQEFSDLDFHYVPVFTSLSGRIKANTLQTNLENLADFSYYLVGSSGFLADIKDMLITQGVDKRDIKIDDFG